MTLELVPETDELPKYRVNLSTISRGMNLHMLTKTSSAKSGTKTVFVTEAIAQTVQ